MSEVAREGNGGSRPVPDPTVLTDKAIDRALKAERDRTDGLLEVIAERLRGIDHATELLAETIKELPSRIDEKVEHLEKVTNEKFDSINKEFGERTTWLDERFNSIQTQFKERDERASRESLLNKTAVDAAFAAQKEAASEQNKSNTLAITKSEAATAETIQKLAELVGSKTEAIADKVDDLKERVSRMESIKQGVAEFKGESHAAVSNIGAIVGIVAAILASAALYFGLHRTTPTPITVDVPTVTVPAK